MTLNKIGNNETEVTFGDVTVLFSYNTPVAAHVCPYGFFRTSKSWSRTTSRHVGAFLTRHNATPSGVQTRAQDAFDALMGDAADVSDFVGMRVS